MKTDFLSNKFIALIIVLCCVSSSNIKALAVDVNLSGSANLNLNNANNNKLTTPLRNFDPGSLNPDQIDLTPLATPPLTKGVKVINGAYLEIQAADPDFSNAKQAKEILRKSGEYVGPPPETIAADKPVQDYDIQDFLVNYYKYLKDEGLSSAGNTMVPQVAPAAALVAHPKTLTAKKASSKQKESKSHLP